MLFFSTTYAFYKEVGTYIPNTVAVFFQSSFSFLLVLPFLIGKEKSFFNSDKIPMIALRTVIGLTGLVLITTALRTIDLADVVVLNNTAPFFVPFLAFIFLKEKIAHKLWPGIIVGFIGIFIVLRPGFREIKWGLIFALLSGVFSGALFIPTRRIAHEPILRVLFYYFLFTMILMSLFLLGSWETPPSFVWGFLALSGLSMALAQITFTWALRFATAQEASPFLYTIVVFSGLIDWLAWHVVPDLISLIGWIVICLAGVLTAFLTAQKKA